MKTIYEYSELSDSAKNNVRLWYYDNICTEQGFVDWKTDILNTLFPNSTFDITVDSTLCDVCFVATVDLMDGLDWLLYMEDVKLYDYLLTDAIYALPDTRISVDFTKNEQHNLKHQQIDRSFMSDFGRYMAERLAYAYSTVNREPTAEEKEMCVYFCTTLYDKLMALGLELIDDMWTYFNCDEDSLIEYVYNNGYVFDEDGNVMQSFK